MDIKRCYEILELDPDASLEDAKQAYRDLVNVWHPDRVSNNPRLKQKAEEKLKEVNTAYEKVKAFVLSGQNQEPAQKEAPRPGARAEPEPGTGARARPGADDSGKAHAEARERDRTEAAVEAATGIILGACSHLYNSIRRLVVDQIQRAGAETEAGQATVKESRSQTRGYGSGKAPGRGMDKGRGMGRGRGTGRGRGMGRGRRRGRP